jgi:acetyl esterase/lipase
MPYDPTNAKPLFPKSFAFYSLGKIILPMLLVSVFTPTSSAVDPKFKGFTNVPFENVQGKDVCLDVYVDPNISWKRPLVIYIHGGGWQGRNRADGAVYADSFLKRGYVYATIDYRLTNQAIFPAQIQDAKAAVRFLRSHATDYHIDPDEIGVFGHSSGGHLVSLLGTTNGDPQFDTGENLTVSNSVQAVCDMSGPVDLTTPDPALAPMLTKLLGGPVDPKMDLAKLASPINHITPACPPFLILHGANDPAVPPAESQSFASALRKAGVPVKIMLLPGQPHNLNLWAKIDKGNYLNIIVDFFDANLKKKN